MTPLAQLRVLLTRNLREGVRNPVLAYGLSLAIPLLVLVLVAQTLSRVTELPGFPTHNYAEWMTPGIVMLTAMTGTGYAAGSLVVDIQSGFVDRLRLLDAHPGALLLSRMLFDVVRVVPGGAAVLIVGIMLGTKLNQGLLGVVTLLGLLTLWAAAYGGLYFVVGLTTRNAQAPLALAPLSLPLQFLSTEFLPAPLLRPWVEAASRWNPFTYMVDASRALTTGPFSALAVAKAFDLALVLLMTTQLATLSAFQRAIDAR